ncbi:LysR substrate-binding domain-containing protein [Herbiconiux daphne]|nr:LysR substrate-binding domain-containing protein [Herbiconiux daphne]
MDVHRAQAFLAVAEELHFGRAAERLHMAQPPLTRLIRQLEADLGAVLFERNTRSVALTVQGEALMEPAHELVMLSRRITEIVRRTQGGLTGRVRLGYAGPSVGHLVGVLARRVRIQRPDLALELYSSQFSHRALDKLREGSLDLVIGRWDFLPAEIGSRVIEREQLLLALPERHPLAKKETIEARELADEAWIVLPGGSAATLPNRLNALAVEGRFIPRIVQVAPDSSTLMLLVGAETGVALTFSGVRDHIPAEGVVFRRLASTPGAVEVRLAWRHSDTSPALAAVAGLVANSAEAPGST